MSAFSEIERPRRSKPSQSNVETVDDSDRDSSWRTPGRSAERIWQERRRVARKLDVPTNRVTGILNGQRAITGDTALRLAHFFGTSAEFFPGPAKPIRTAPRPEESRQVDTSATHVEAPRAPSCVNLAALIKVHRRLIWYEMHASGSQHTSAFEISP